MLLLLLATVLPSHAQFPGERFAEDVVVGANLVVGLGATEGSRLASRLGFGLDVGYERQAFTQRAVRIDGDFTVWAEEHVGYHYGVAVHVWWRAGWWQTSIAALLGFAHPLRVGTLADGWVPGPGLAVEVGPVLSTAGYVGLDLQGVLDAPYMRIRAGRTLTWERGHDSRLHLGGFAPLHGARDWEGSVRRDPRDE